MVGNIVAFRWFDSGSLLIHGAAWLIGFAGLAQAGDLQGCRELRQRRDALASRAMEQELALVRTFRGRICPRLAKQAEGANARDRQFIPINYAAWSNCRKEAERQLEATHSVRYRNRQGFTFYTAAGAALAVQADQLSKTWEDQGCR